VAKAAFGIFLATFAYAVVTQVLEGARDNEPAQSRAVTMALVLVLVALLPGPPIPQVVVLLMVAEEFGLDVVLGAFLAGIVLRRWAPGDVDALEDKLDAK
jgi:Kef-type K+ transport system membrane component KefB